MLLLYHQTLSPYCRKIRLILAEKQLAFTLRLEKTWEERPEFLALNPTGEVPVLIDEDGTKICGSQVIAEYLEEMYDSRPLLGAGAVVRAEVRRLIDWFDRKFHQEVGVNLVDEKIYKRLRHSGEPDSAAIRAGWANMRIHLNYIEWMMERRNWLAGDDMTLADLTAAAHLSAIDYLGDIPWEQAPLAKEWYAKVKSRPSFRPLLADHIPGVPPPPHYADLDF